MKLNLTFKSLKLLGTLSLFLLMFTYGKLFGQSVSLPTDRARVTIAEITDAYNPAGPKLKVLRTDANTPLRGGTAWIWEKQGQEEPESYYALMKSKGLNLVRMVLFDTWEVETYPPSSTFTPTDWNDPAYRERQLARMERCVNYASAHGMYVMINSHNHIPLYNEAYTSALWSYVAPYFANRTHVFFELANEPMGGIGRNGDMDMGVAGATSSPRLQALKRSYDIARAGAPNTMMLILTPPGINDHNYGTGMGNLADAFGQLPGTPVDWTKTGVAYHLYGNDAAYGAATNAANLRNLHQRYVGFPTENSFPASVYVYQGDEWRSPSFDNDLYVNQTCEKLGIGWDMWFINGANQLNNNFPTLWADAVAKGWAWDPDPTTPVAPLGIKLTGTVIGTNGTWGVTSPDDKSTVFDGNIATFFDCTTADYAWAGIDLGNGAAEKVTSIRFYPRASYPGRMTNGKFQGSNTADFSSGVVDLYTIGSQPSVVWQQITISNTNTFRYLRYLAPVGGYGNVAEVEFYIKDTQNPTAPQSVSATGNTSSRLNINWNASTDNVGVVSYEIFNGATSLGNTANTSFLINGLTPGISYAITVKAKDAAGNVSVASGNASNANTLVFDATIPYASSAPVIDGTKEASWTGANLTIGNLATGAVANSSDLSGTWNASWDNSNLYLFISVTDDVIRTDGPNWYDDDRIEIFIDADGNRGTTYTAKDYQYYIRPGETVITETKLNATANVQVSNVSASGGYRLEVKIPFATLGITPASLNKLGIDVQIGDDDDGGTVDGKLAWYAINDNSWADPSLFGVAQLGAIPGDTQAPSVPAGLTSSAITANSFTLSWTASTDNIAVTGYEVFKDGVSVGTTASTSMSITSLTLGAGYSMTVKARDAVPNWSAASAALNVTTIDPKLTGTVIGTNGTWGTYTPDDKSVVFDGNTATFFDCTTADYAWAGLDLGSTYQITSIKYYPRSNFPERMTNGVFEGSNTADFSSGVVQLGVINTQPAVAWSTLTVTNPSGFRYVRFKSPVGGYGNVAEVEFHGIGFSDTQAPTVPVGLTSTAITATSFTLSWSASTDNIAVTGYEVFKNGVSVGTTASTSLSITGLTSAVSYSMTVKARDAVPNWSAASTALPVNTTDNVAPSIPAGLNSTVITATSFTLNWNASTDNVAVTGYEVFKNGVSVGTTASTSMTITGLTSAVSYSMTVKARDAAANWSAASAALNVTTMDAKLTGTVIGTNGTWGAYTPDDKSVVFDGNTVTFFDCTTADYAWAGLDLGSTYQITSIKYYPRSNYPGRMTNGVFEGSNTADFSSGVTTLATITIQPGVAWNSITVNNTNGFRYVRYKSPVGGYGNVAEVEFYGLVSTDNVAPIIPAGLTGSGITTTGFTLSWTASTDNVAVTGYDVFKDGVLYSSVAATTASITGLTPGVTYQMTVKAKDAAGNISAFSAAKGVQTASNNILLNPGFENGTTSWTGQYGCTLTAGTNFRTGTKGGSVTARANQYAGPEQTITSAVSSLGSGNYYLEAWVKMASGSSTVKATFKYRYNNTDYYLGVQGVVGTTWTKLSGTVNVAYTGTLQMAQFYLETTAGTTSFYVDDCIVNMVGQLKSASIANPIALNPDFGKVEAEVLLYPNPASERLNVSNAGINAELAIYSLDGKLIKQLKADATDFSIDVSNWKKGLYIIKISNESKTHTRKFVVK